MKTKKLGVKIWLIRETPEMYGMHLSGSIKHTVSTSDQISQLLPPNVSQALHECVNRYVR